MEREMEHEIDISIARFIREQWEREEEEERERLRKQYDPKERITYTLEELIDGIRKGKQYLYTLRLEFEPRLLLGGRITIPYIRDFFDAEEDEPGTALLVSSKRNLSINISGSPCRKAKQPMEQWIRQTTESMKKLHLIVQPEKKAALRKLEYFCYIVPTSAGRLYNVMFRMQKEDWIYVGALNCQETERKGMGLLLEAMVHVIEEMNQ